MYFETNKKAESALAHIQKKYIEVEQYIMNRLGPKRLCEYLYSQRQIYFAKVFVSLCL